MSDTIALVAIFIAIPLAIAFFGVRNYRNIARREAEEAAEARQAASEPAKAKTE